MVEKQEKICNSCKLKKSIDFFSANRSSKDGYDYQCKACVRERRKKWSQANKHRHLVNSTPKELAKVCGHCRLYKPITFFSISRCSKDGYVNWCKECVKQDNKKTFKTRQTRCKNYRAKNKERIIKNKKQWEKNNIDRHLAIPMNSMHRKICSNCGVDQPISMFSLYRASKSGYSSKCKKCVKESRNKTFEERRTYTKNYFVNNRERITVRNKKYKQDHKEDRALYERTRKATDPSYRLRCTVSSLVYHCITRNGGSKAGLSFFKCVGYTAEDLKQHLECQFLPTMSWNNYGSYWELHHIKPQGSFNFVSLDEDSFKECWSLENIMPLEITKNQELGAFFRTIKNSRVIPAAKPIYHTNNSILPWVLEEITRKAAIRVLTNKKEAELCL
jgi:hypothetical protein